MNLRLQPLSRRTEAACVYWTKRVVHLRGFPPSWAPPMCGGSCGRAKPLGGHPATGSQRVVVPIGTFRPVARGVGASGAGAGAHHAAGGLIQAEVTRVLALLARFLRTQCDG